MPDALKWDTRLTVMVGAKLVTPIDSFNPTFTSPVQPLHSLEADNVAHIVQPQDLHLHDGGQGHRSGGGHSSRTWPVRTPSFSVACRRTTGKDWTFTQDRLQRLLHHLGRQQHRHRRRADHDLQLHLPGSHPHECAHHRLTGLRRTDVQTRRTQATSNESGLARRPPGRQDRRGTRGRRRLSSRPPGPTSITTSRSTWSWSGDMGEETKQEIEARIWDTLNAALS